MSHFSEQNSAKKKGNMFSFAKDLLAMYFIMNEGIIQRQAAVSVLFSATCLHQNVMSFNFC